MAETIIQSLRTLASKIEILGERADEIIKKDKDLASDFRELLKVVPATWRRASENRLFSQVKKNKKPNDIQECHRKVIWSWKETHEKFCSRQARNTINSHDTSALDGLIGGIESDDTDLVLSSVHWRISLLLIALVKDRVCKDTTDPGDIATCFHSNGLVSTGKLNYLKNNIRQWVEGGVAYQDLSLNLGGYGSLIYLPDIGRTSYETHYSPTKESAYAIIGALTPSITPVATQNFDGVNAHNVVEVIVQNTIDRIKDFRLIIIPVRYADIQQSERTSRAEKGPVGNQSSQTRKRPNENSQGTPGSKIRRVDLHRAAANTNNDNVGARQSDPSASEETASLIPVTEGLDNSATTSDGGEETASPGQGPANYERQGRIRQASFDGMSDAPDNNYGQTAARSDTSQSYAFSTTTNLDMDYAAHILSQISRGDTAHTEGDDSFVSQNDMGAGTLTAVRAADSEGTAIRASQSESASQPVLYPSNSQFSTIPASHSQVPDTRWQQQVIDSQQTVELGISFHKDRTTACHLFGRIEPSYNLSASEQERYFDTTTIQSRSLHEPLPEPEFNFDDILPAPEFNFDDILPAPEFNFDDILPAPDTSSFLSHSRVSY